MALTSTPVFVQTPNIGSVQILNADTSNSKYLMTGGVNGSKVTGLWMTSTDSVNHVVQILRVSGGISYLIGSANVAANSGADNLIPAVNALSPTLIPGLPLDADGSPYILMKSGDTLNVQTTVAVTAAKNLVSQVIFGDF